MSIKIHHGANGSFKTSGAIQDDLTPAILEGRYIITNIRGLNLDRVLSVYPDAPSSLEIVNLSLESSDDLERMRTWFMWAPAGAFLIFDETQILFPKSWRDSDLKRFDYPGGPDAAKQADRPTGWLDAWTRHRHWNWDIVLTTPNIRYIRDEIRLTCEKAYLHANLGLLGPAFKALLRKDYKEAMHDAQENRPTSGDVIVKLKKIQPETFRLYDSTSTGNTRDTAAGVSIFTSPKLLLLLGILASAFAYAFNSGGLDVLTAGLNPSLAEPLETPPPVDLPRADPPRADLPDKPRADRQTPVTHPFDGLRFVVRAVISGRFNAKAKDVLIFDLVDEEGLSFQQTGDQLRSLGYRAIIRNECFVELHRDDWHGFAMCPGVDATARAEKFVQLEADRLKALSEPPKPERLTLTHIPDNSRDGRPLTPTN